MDQAMMLMLFPRLPTGLLTCSCGAGGAEFCNACKSCDCCICCILLTLLTDEAMLADEL